MENKKDFDIEHIDETTLKEMSTVPSFWKIVKSEFKHDKAAVFALAVLAVIFAVIIIGGFILDTETVMKVSLRDKFSVPGKKFILGADLGGRPILPQLIIGARNSVLIAFSVTIITEIIGIFFGLLTGFYGGRVDNIIMRICDFIIILPIMMLIIVFVTIVPTYNIWTFIFIMSAFYWTGVTRLVRSKALSENRRDYVNASRIMGTSDFKIMYGGILPNISSIIIVNFTLGMAGNIGIETGMSFLGFGLPPTSPSLGTLIGYARDPGTISSKLWVWLPASILIMVLMLCINYVGQTIKRASDAKQRYK
ncbi:MAG: ABC transporter permease [Treponema sp.]|uniref:ABC transporter permease n=1 Tax=Treponema sp. TaxID=166 RepID=UPI003FA30ACB